MRKTYLHRIFAGLLCLCMLVGVLPIGPVRATGQIQGVDSAAINVVNEISAGTYTYEQQTAVLRAASSYPRSGKTYITNKADAVETLKEGLLDRETEIIFDYRVRITDFMGSASPDNKTVRDEAFNQMTSELISSCYAHTGDGREGDYLRHNSDGYYVSSMYSWDGTYFYFNLVYQPRYFANAYQEKAMDVAVENLMEQFNFSKSDTDYEKVCTIYSYICDNVVYDYANLYNDSYKLKYSAYAALMDGTAVCNGYALLLYRLLLEADVDNRIIVGMGGDELHAWNIIELGEKYFNADSTWDAGNTQFLWFLLPESAFYDHTRNEEYCTKSFNKQYPMTTAAYRPAPAAPKTVTAQLTGYDDVKVSWSEVSNASYYRVYMQKAGDEKFTRLADTKRTYYVKENLGDGVKYTFRIVPILKEDGEEWLGEGKTATAQTLKKVTGVQVSKASSGQVKVSWKNISGESGYAISRYPNGESAKTVSSVASSKATSKVVSAPKGVKQYYRVRAYKTVDGKKIYGPWSDPVSYILPPAAPKTVTAELTAYNDVKVSWSEVTGATSYRVYMKKASGSYKKVKETKYTTYQVKDLADGVEYTFKIVPVTKSGSKVVTGAYRTDSVITLQKVTGVKVSKTDGKSVKVRWKNIPGESGYAISQYENGKSAKTVETVKSTKAITETVPAAWGKTLYYRVRAYKTADGKKIYGPWSDPIAFKRK